MTIEKLKYIVTGTETPIHMNEREESLMKKCLQIINEKEKDIEFLENEITDILDSEGLMSDKKERFLPQESGLPSRQ